MRLNYNKVMQIGNRFRCYPTDGQAQSLAQWIGCQRVIYNAKVQEDRYYRRFQRKALPLVGERVPVDQQYARFKDKELTPWLYDVPAVILRNGATRFAQSYQRFFKGLGGRPKIKKKHGKQSVWLTSELFEFVPIVDAQTGEITDYRLLIGNKSHALGELRFKAHTGYQLPASVVITCDIGQWFVSFNYDDGEIELSEQERIDHIKAMSEKELRAVTVGLDRGVVIPVATSDDETFNLSDTQKQRIESKEKRVKRWQRKQARRLTSGINQKKAKNRAAKARRYGRNVRHDFAHKTSHALAHSGHQLFVVENLNVKGMTAKAKPKQDENGNYVKNGKAAKSGLNRSILKSAWGNTTTFLTYKAARLGKLVVSVPAHHSSQACSDCGYTHQDNRVSQALFVCQVCGHTENADFNASKVIKERGIALVRSDEFTAKKRKKTRLFGADHARAGRSEVTPGENVVSRGGGQSAATPCSSSQELPLATAETPT